jgi:hypothetical protein
MIPGNNPVFGRAPARGFTDRLRNERANRPGRQPVIRRDDNRGSRASANGPRRFNAQPGHGHNLPYQPEDDVGFHSSRFVCLRLRSRFRTAR